MSRPLTYVQGSNRGMSSEQLGQRGHAVLIAPLARDADKAEFQRLTQQTEELRKWLQA